MKIQAALLAFTCLAVSPAWAINKCSIDGKVVFQDTACPGKGEVLVVRPASGQGSAAAPVAPAAPTKQPPAAQTAAPTQPAPPPLPVQVKSPLELEADQCLAWYRPFLRDPHGAYYTNLAKDQRVFSMDLHATNGYGGYVIKRATCEINAGRLDEAWTKIHAKRGNWPVE